MFSYVDDYGGQVTIYFTKQKGDADDVLVIPLYLGKWLFTKHRVRGIEFPGGKGEKGESNEEAAARELMEETGARTDQFHFVADYSVKSDGRSFTKRVFFL
ncbi:MutT/nudix hydrolase family protein [Listeria floridensis FSL S10-1187]|uniref:MutT/nudix hydrolase family protein n=1 Tax=Listeria floridensis FSL S10-1187 TaxID=1265817 RepID=A0ABN0RI05_9LIST|nr:MutT/nudix hydrolase family protein [Listeria floridensis FSL S10-1187]